MNSGELLRRKLATVLLCEKDQLTSGPTGPSGQQGQTGPTGPIAEANSNTMKTFTLYLDYSTTVQNGINGITRLYLPAGLSTDPSISAGGEFSADIPGVLVFNGLNTININNTTFPMPIGLSATGYTGTNWSLTAYGIIGTAGRIVFTSSADYTINLTGLTPSNMNGGNVANRPSSGILSGWLGTLTIYFL
jgi:hypothetical protein